jgi:hypothetical protein
MQYALYPRQDIQLTRFHCRRCHRTAYINQDKAPTKCPNIHGYLDEKGIFYKPCSSRRWHIWPSNFDPNNITCEHCLYLWRQEQLDPTRVQKPKRSGPKPKRRLVDTEE